jgi:hypothetical protein
MHSAPLLLVASALQCNHVVCITGVCLSTNPAVVQQPHEALIGTVRQAVTATFGYVQTSGGWEMCAVVVQRAYRCHPAGQYPGF